MRTYIIVPSDCVGKLIESSSSDLGSSGLLQKKASSVRLSLDGKWAILKWEKAKPQAIADCEKDLWCFAQYSVDEIISKIEKDPNWQSINPNFDAVPKIEPVIGVEQLATTEVTTEGKISAWVWIAATAIATAIGAGAWYLCH